MPIMTHSYALCESFSRLIRGYHPFIAYICGTMAHDISARVLSLRTYLSEHRLDAFIIPSTDPHSGEYVPERWMTRQWLTGFTGSAGTAVVTAADAALWTDSRYFLAAADQLRDTPFRLMRQGLAETPSIAAWLAQTLPAGAHVAVDATVNTIDSVEGLRSELQARGLQLDVVSDPFDDLWPARPTPPMSPAELQPLQYAGRTAREKLDTLRADLRAIGARSTVVSQLDEVAWLTNLRGRDVHCCPVLVSYLLVSDTAATLYIYKEKLTPEVEAYLAGEGITTRPYDALWTDLARAPQPLQLDPAWSNYALMRSLTPLRHKSLVAPRKAVKNEAEIRGYRSAMLKDGIAMVKFLRWLVPAVERGGQTECSIDRELTRLRAEQPLYRDISFDTIAGYGPHAAIVHYEPTPETDIPLQPRGLLLLDSGAQYQDGTTDITRTIALGPLTPEERHHYTLVLRGHIRLAMAKFPAGSSGTQLDVCARYAMWQEGLNYLHGTGHGVGSYLNVHEGPHQFRMNYMPAPLLAGMTVTVEPGIYIAGKHGARTENTMLITHHSDGEYGEFLQMEPLTLCPIDLTPVNRDEMEPAEIDYLNRYHAHVRAVLLPHLTDAQDREWLTWATRTL